MPKIELFIDPKTGALTLHITSVPGPACDDVARLAKELLGQPGVERQMSE